MKTEQLLDFIVQSLEHERGGIHIYETALTCVLDADLRAEWDACLEEMRQHEQILLALCATLRLDAELEIPARAIVRGMGQSLVEAMERALVTSEPAAAELIACECVVLAKTKDHFNWQMIGRCSDAIDGSLSSRRPPMQDELIAVGGMKTLIAHNYYSEDDFWKTWNRRNYEAVKARMDPENIFRGLYEKTCGGARTQSGR